MISISSCLLLVYRNILIFYYWSFILQFWWALLLNLISVLWILQSFLFIRQYHLQIEVVLLFSQFVCFYFFLLAWFSGFKKTSHVLRIKKGKYKNCNHRKCTVITSNVETALLSILIPFVVKAKIKVTILISSLKTHSRWWAKIW